MTESEFRLKSMWLEMYIKMYDLLENVDRYYDFTFMVDDKGGFVFGMCEMHNWKFWLGRGKTLQEAIVKSVPIMDIYGAKTQAATRQKFLPS